MTGSQVICRNVRTEGGARKPATLTGTGPSRQKKLVRFPVSSAVVPMRAEANSSPTRPQALCQKAKVSTPCSNIKAL